MQASALSKIAWSLLLQLMKDWTVIKCIHRIKTIVICCSPVMYQTSPPKKVPELQFLFSSTMNAFSDSTTNDVEDA